ncbi:EamA-like transporter [Aureococcus anophagefferens]|nr:EamA-like transporter [Aureococcus anophagefferens]
MPSQIAPRTALIWPARRPPPPSRRGAARASAASGDGGPEPHGQLSQKLAPAPETALRAEVLRRKLEGRLTLKEENDYLATLESTGALAPARSTPRAPYDAEYLDELDRSTWASTLFQKELARRGVGAAAGEVEYLEGLDAGGEPEESSPLAWRGAMLFVTVAWATNFALTAFACEDLGAAAGLDGSTAALVFVALRFFVASASTAPFLADASPGVLASGAKIGGLCAFGYFAQAAAFRWASAVVSRWRAVEEHPDDAVALSAIQCVVIFGGAAAALGAALGAPTRRRRVLGVVDDVAGRRGDSGLLADPHVRAALGRASPRGSSATRSRGDVAGGLLILGACAVNDGLVPLPDFLDEPELA